jgi:hypothetical protein
MLKFAQFNPPFRFSVADFKTSWQRLEKGILITGGTISVIILVAAFNILLKSA